MSSAGAEEGLASSEIFLVLILMNPSSVSVHGQVKIVNVIMAKVYVYESKQIYFAQKGITQFFS